MHSFVHNEVLGGSVGGGNPSALCSMYIDDYYNGGTSFRYVS